MSCENEIKKLVLFVVNSFYTTEGNAFASTIPLIMDKDDKTTEYATLMIVNNTDNALQFCVATSELAKKQFAGYGFCYSLDATKMPNKQNSSRTFI